MSIYCCYTIIYISKFAYFQICLNCFTQFLLLMPDKVNLKDGFRLSFRN